MELPRVCQSQACLYKANPAVDVFTRAPGIRFYLCERCSIRLAPALRKLHYTWHRLAPDGAIDTTITKEYDHE